MFLSSSAMDIKEIKFPDIQNTVNKPGCGQGAGSEPTIVPSGHHGQSNKIFDLQAAALITTLLRSPSYTEVRTWVTYGLITLTSCL